MNRPVVAFAALAACVVAAPKVLRFVQIENKIDTLLELQAVRAVLLAKP
jgi:hypothetical protein